MLKGFIIDFVRKSHQNKLKLIKLQVSIISSQISELFVESTKYMKQVSSRRFSCWCRLAIHKFILGHKLEISRSALATRWTSLRCKLIVIDSCKMVRTPSGRQPSSSSTPALTLAAPGRKRASRFYDFHILRRGAHSAVKYCSEDFFL